MCSRKKKFTGKHLWQNLILACNFIKKETLAQVFCCEFCEIFKNLFFTEHLWATASVYCWSKNLKIYWLKVLWTITWIQELYQSWGLTSKSGHYFNFCFTQTSAKTNNIFLSVILKNHILGPSWAKLEIWNFFKKSRSSLFCTYEVLTSSEKQENTRVTSRKSELVRYSHTDGQGLIYRSSRNTHNQI